MATGTTMSQDGSSRFLIPLETEHEEIGAVWQRHSGLKAIVAIHSTACGPALGGTRFRRYETVEEALFDVLRLSKAMSYKAAMAGLNLGGGKAVILGDPQRDKTEPLLEAYAAFLDRFDGRYLTAEDVGTSQADMDFLGQRSRFVTGRSAELGGSGDPSPITAYGVVRAMEATAEALWGSSSLEGRRVNVSGVGKVGHSLALLCAQRGARVTAADVSGDAVKALLKEMPGVEAADPENIHRLDCDVYAPCALGGALNDQTVPELACQAVCGAANNQLADETTEAALQVRGITYVPDYVANAGGIINIAYERGGYDGDAARAHVARIFDTTAELFEVARKTGDALSVIADRTAEQRIAAAEARRSS
jgi:valine dehydrogenase (NAD+)